MQKKKKKMEVTTSQTLWDFDEICLLERFFNKHTIQQHESSWCDVNCDVIVMWFLIVFRVEMFKWESLYSIIDVWVGP